MGSEHEANKSSNQTNSPYAVVATPELVSDSAWCLDSGASHHVTNDLSKLQQVSKFNGKTQLTVGNGSTIPIHHTGSTILPSLSHKPLILKNVIHSPLISRNLVSVSQLAAQNNLYVEFDSNSFSVKEKITKKELLQGKIKDGLYQIEPMAAVSAVSPQINIVQSESLLDWHIKLGCP